MRYWLGIDIGTGSTKAVAVDAYGECLLSKQVYYPLISPEPKLAEQDPLQILHAFQESVRAITIRFGQPQAIALSSAMHSLLPVNEQGIPLTNLLIWADNRSAEIASELRHLPEGDSIYAKGGTPIHAMAPITKAIWIRRHNPDVFKKTARFISIKEFVWFHMFNEFEVDYSIASATGWFDILAKQWNPEALAYCGITHHHLSRVVPTHFVRRGISVLMSDRMGLSAETPVMIGASDGCLANVGSRATKPGVAALTIGTSGALRICSNVPVIDYHNMPFNYCLDDERFIVGGPINNGGVALKWYAENFLKVPLVSDLDYDKVLHGVEAVEAGSGGLIFLPYLFGERAPIWNSNACGVFFGIRGTHHQSHLTRALLEGISLSLFHIATRLEANQIFLHTIHVSGGFIQSPVWVKLLTDIFGIPVHLVNGEDASAMGSVFLYAAYHDQALADSIQTPEPIRIEPDEKKHKIYRNLIFPKYLRLYQLLSTEMSQY